MQASLGLSAALVGARARADTPPSSDLRALDLRLPGDPRVARRALVLAPAHVPPGTRLPMLVLLHGLGETVDERLGIHAWGERYGLVRAYERLLRPPFERTLARQRYLTDEHRDAINRALSAAPFRGMVLVCPFTPNPWKLDGAHTIGRYADWLVGTLLPAVRDRVPVIEGRGACGLDGCSLGGYVGIEVFLRKPESFGVLGVVQAAISKAGAAQYARRIADAVAKAGPCPVHVETSTGDPYRAACEELGRHLGIAGLPHDLKVIPGPHDQPWLREIGTPELLLWHDRALRRAPLPPAPALSPSAPAPT